MVILMFKEKSSKKRIVTHRQDKDAATLDARHQQVLQTLSEHHQQLAAHVERRASLTRDLERLRARIRDMKLADQLDTPEYDQLWTRALSMDAELRKVHDTIQRLQANTDEIEYYEDTGKILMNYYHLLENHDTSGPAKIPLPPVRPHKGRKKISPVLGRNILEAFHIHPLAEDAARPATPALTPAATPAATPTVHKSTLVDEYLSATDPTYLPPMAPEEDCLCAKPECRVPLLCLQAEGIMVCPKCGYQEILLVEQNRAMIRPSSKEASHMSYKRINHFREWCSQVQGKESTDIPEEVFERILAEIKKEKITDVKKITYAKMREILKRLRINKYYEHIQYLMHRITGVPPPYFPPELEEKLCQMFKEVQPAFVRHCPKNRSNFLSYSFCLSMFFRILGAQDPRYNEYLKYFPLLRARDKLYTQDQIFKAICKDLGWPFIPSV